MNLRPTFDSAVDRPLAIDLFCGLGGWTEGLLAEGYYVVGFDIEQHVYGEHRYPAQLVIQDVLTLHGRQFKDATLIVASPPCQEFSYMAMPWSLAKAKQARIQADPDEQKRLTALFDACFRIQREACEAAGRHIPLVVENVKGAQKWVGRARWNFGSFYLWGDVPALMPIVVKRRMKSAISCSPRRWDERIARTPEEAHSLHYRLPTKNSGGSWFNIGSPGQKETNRKPVHEAAKNGGDWFASGADCSLQRKASSGSKARKAASAMIAKIPLALSRHIAQCWKPQGFAL